MITAARKYKTQKIVNKRLRVVKRVWRNGEEQTPGVLRKWNLGCGCRMCHWDKYYEKDSPLLYINKQKEDD